MLDPERGHAVPWKEQSTVDQRAEFCELATREGANVSALCVAYGISRGVGYTWLGRWRAEGAAGLVDRSRRPLTSPARTATAVEDAVLAARALHPTWGGRKLHHWLRAQGVAAPAPSTITAILDRHERLAPPAARTRPWQRFERTAPNALWQLDFMGHRPLADAAGSRVHPLTVLDDHSRFALGLVACAVEQAAVVQTVLTSLFRRYGLPDALLTDNGSPWGACGTGGISALEAWLIRLGITVLHGGAYHPQTQGKIERLHRTIAADVFASAHLPDLAAAQAAFDGFRADYNQARPHAAIGHLVPLARYAPSPRRFPDPLPPVAYAPDDQVRRVQRCGTISVGNHPYYISKGVAGQPVALRPTAIDGIVTVRYCHQEIATLDLHRRVRV